MLWLKTMPAERWMAASGAAVMAIGLLGMLPPGRWQRRRGRWPAATAGERSATWPRRLISGAIGAAGAWVVLSLLLVVGLLLYFNMTVGDLVAAWLRRREERAELAAIEARRGSGERRGRPEPVAAPPPPRSGAACWIGSAPPSARERRPTRRR